MEVKKKGTQWRVYKPTKSGTGAASRLEMKVVEEERKSSGGSTFTYRDVQLFWVASPQTGTDERDVAQRLVGIMATKSLEEFDVYTQWFWSQFRTSVEAVAHGDAMSQKHKDEIARLRLIPIDESPAEGFHRETHLRKRRSAFASLPWLKTSVRFKTKP